MMIIIKRNIFYNRSAQSVSQAVCVLRGSCLMEKGAASKRLFVLAFITVKFTSLENPSKSTATPGKKKKELI